MISKSYARIYCVPMMLKNDLILKLVVESLDGIARLQIASREIIENSNRFEDRAQSHGLAANNFG